MMIWFFQVDQVPLLYMLPVAANHNSFSKRPLLLNV